MVDCGPLIKTDYYVFSEYLHNKYGEERIPIKGGIDLTSRCNLRCVHCYIEGTPLKKEHELTYDEICRIFDEIADAGCLWLLLTGGEAMLRRDFADIYRYAKRKGFILTIFTNATLITPEIADMLRDEPPFNIEVSLYGATKETYERITRIPGSYERCLRGIELLVERKIPVSLKSMAMTLNSHELKDMDKIAEKFGLEFRFDTQLNASLDSSDGPLSLRLSPEEILKLDLADEKRVQGMHDYCNNENNWQVPRHDRLFTCGSGHNSFHVTSSGRLIECVLSRGTNYDLLKGSFHEGFYEEMPKVVERRRTRHSECQDCVMTGLCGICPALAELETGDPEAKVDWLCKVAHLRADTFKPGWSEKVLTKLR